MPHLDSFPFQYSDQLHRQVRRFVDACLENRRPEQSFDELAVSLARWQASRHNGLDRLLEAEGKTAEQLVVADDIPAIPTDVFKLTRVACHPEQLDEVTFLTSGTTVGDRGRHPMRTVSTYRHVARAWARRLLIPDTERLDWILLAPDYAQDRSSSLGFMLDDLSKTYGRNRTWAVREGAVDLSSVESAIRRAREDGFPLIVAGAAFAFVHLLDQASGRDLRLGKAGRVMITGGFKGKSREVSAERLQAMVGDMFGIPSQAMIGEYGMTELSSQAYQPVWALHCGLWSGDEPAEKNVYIPPPWMRISAVDPVTLRPVAKGEEGIARIVDLANVDSAVAIQTSDRVRMIGEGVMLLGRTPGAVPRGCSIGVDEILGG